jgi:hypothetical protein
MACDVDGRSRVRLVRGLRSGLGSPPARMLKPNWSRTQSVTCSKLPTSTWKQTGWGRAYASNVLVGSLLHASNGLGTRRGLYYISSSARIRIKECTLFATQPVVCEMCAWKVTIWAEAQVLRKWIQIACRKASGNGISLHVVS